MTLPLHLTPFSVIEYQSACRSLLSPLEWVLLMDHTVSLCNSDLVSLCCEIFTFTKHGLMLPEPHFSSQEIPGSPLDVSSVPLLPYSQTEMLL